MDDPRDHGHVGWKKAASDPKPWKLITLRESEVIREKILGLERGWYRKYLYGGLTVFKKMQCKPNPQAAKQLNEILIKKGNPEAIQRKIEGLKHGGDHVYTISRGHQFSSYGMEMEMRDARHPTYGYEKDELELKRFLESIKMKQ